MTTKEASVELIVANVPASAPLPAGAQHRVDGRTRGVWGRLLDRVGAAVAHRIDAVLITLLVWNLSVLFLSTMPRSYFFGLKAAFLQKISRSLLYKAYLRTAPLSVAGFLALVAVAAPQVQRPIVARWRSLTLAHGLLMYVQGRLYELIRGDAAPVLELEERATERELINWGPLSPEAFDMITYPQRRLMPAVLLGRELLPPQRQRLLFVGNHAVWGLDVPVLLHTLYKQEGIFPRPLGSHAWFAAPGIKEVVADIVGAVDGTEQNCDLLMRRGQNLLVYPGGEREAWKKVSDAKYSLMWGESRGFARLALRHAYTIIPVATVGTEDAFQVVADFPLSKFLRLGGLIPAAKSKRTGGTAFVEGSTLPVLLPRPGRMQRLYFKLGRPIPARLPAWLGEPGSGDPDSNCFEPTDADVDGLRDEVRDAVAEEVRWLLAYRETDPDRYTSPVRAVREAVSRSWPRTGAHSRL